jgi:hypothetical protein
MAVKVFKLVNHFTLTIRAAGAISNATANTGLAPRHYQQMNAFSELLEVK